MNSNDIKNTPVFVLCGGLGTRLKEETEFRPKPMVPVGPQPILWHILRKYRKHGFRRFVLCLGFKAEVVKSYFLNYATLSSDFTVDIGRNAMTLHPEAGGDDWEITLAFTGELTMTGGRVARAAEKYLGDAKNFAVTYGDGLTDADLAAEFQFHAEHGKIGTVLGVNPPSRFGEIQLKGDEVQAFAEKPAFTENWINGGYFFFRREFLKYVSTDESCVLERTPLVKLAADRELRLWRHQGYWACMDTQRDRDELNALWNSGKAPWR